MNIMPISSYSNKKVNFKSLEIIGPKTWNPEYLEKFVHNTEVQKAVKMFHDKKINLNTVYSPGLFDERVTVLVNDADSWETMFKVKDLDTFSAEKALAHYDKLVKANEEHDTKIADAMSFVEKFNKFLEENK